MELSLVGILRDTVYKNIGKRITEHLYGLKECYQMEVDNIM